ncbi:MAG: hypothetical protein UY86_C0001G0006 [Candidatus Adlerbacteria bacterium GW2011_GWB1_54_7]|uniref:Uncharacterized protein n=2 Tax=Candidatus Adleribacteriota TaxID=1752736 RepID=A0A1F4XZB3_9BACT|nr:MAG: hypothetical protein UY86_C0001G0006 [Candidatus Adlerbacteria bacterium GW2011_GWB1_54_7]OGC87060.1 MAG: hypothetical protein A3B33_00335 [Candidatus Adlerbacteria bacterium RIFCSPLOWO2_01_FULL_54_16]
MLHYLKAVESKLIEYPYSSLPDLFDIKRPENALVGKSVLDFYDSVPTIKEMLAEAQAFYQENKWVSRG